VMFMRFLLFQASSDLPLITLYAMVHIVFILTVQ